MNIQKCRSASAIWSALHMEIVDSGWAQLGREWNNSYHCPPFSRLYYILDGEGIARSGQQEMALLPGQMYLLPAGMPLHHECSQQMTQLFFHISARTVDGYDLFSYCRQLLQLPAQENMAKEYLSGDYLSLSLVKARVEADICRFVHLANLEEHLLRPRSAFLEKVFSAVQRELRSSLTISDIAKALALSESTLTKRFRKEYGMPLGRYMDEMLYQQICHLLASTDLSIGQIADDLGFCDQFYLTRFFTARQGISPRQYRQALPKHP